MTMCLDEFIVGKEQGAYTCELPEGHVCDHKDGEYTWPHQTHGPACQCPECRGEEVPGPKAHVCNDEFSSIKESHFVYLEGFGAELKTGLLTHKKATRVAEAINAALAKAR